MGKQDRKVKDMRIKLNKSVDLASIKQNAIDRKQEKYKDSALYTLVTESMKYKDTRFIQKIEEATDPMLSPLTPAQ